jgi:hypothetical protein
VSSTDTLKFLDSVPIYYNRDMSCHLDGD